MNRPSQDPALLLRQQAEDQLWWVNAPVCSQAADSASQHDACPLLHALQVHQLELEMQNDELQRRQHQLEQANARYFELYDLAPVGYCTVSEAGLILQANLCAAGLLGAAGAELVQQPFHRYIAAADQGLYFQCRLRLLDALEQQSCELQLHSVTGPARWISVLVSAAIGADGLPVQHMVLGDITERRQLDLALQRKNQELLHAREMAERANQVKAEFLSNMSHELRSPLHAILGFAQLMDTGKPALTASQRASTAHILRAGWNLLELINEILDLVPPQSSPSLPDSSAPPRLMPAATGTGNTGLVARFNLAQVPLSLTEKPEPSP